MSAFPLPSIVSSIPNKGESAIALKEHCKKRVGQVGDRTEANRDPSVALATAEIVIFLNF